MSNETTNGVTRAAEQRVSIQEALSLVHANGARRTYLLRGTPGIGKTERIYQMAKDMGYTMSVIDAAALDIGELAMPYFEEVGEHEDGTKVRVTSFAPNRRLSVHLDKPVVLFIDELGKANPIVMNALLPILQEHRIGDWKLPEGSIVIGATNLDTDGLGDRIPAHAFNRMTELLVRGPTADEWIKWAVSAGLPSGLIATVKNSPSLLQEYWQEGAEQNNFIFNPKRGQVRNFASARSLAGIAHEVDLFQSQSINTSLFRAAVTGSIGQAAANEVVSYLNFGARLPSLEEVVQNPTAALNKAMDCVAGQHLLVANLALRTDKSTIDAVCAFVQQLREQELTEASVLFGRLLTARQDSNMVGVKESAGMRKLVPLLAAELAG